MLSKNENLTANRINKKVLNQASLQYLTDSCQVSISHTSLENNTHG
jgi:hypothetical protein